jgi:4-oxalocrotonate tautomerase
MPVVTIELIAGRTAAQKKALAERITEAMVETCNARADDVSGLFVDIAPGDWFVAGASVGPPAPGVPAESSPAGGIAGKPG